MPKNETTIELVWYGDSFMYQLELYGIRHAQRAINIYYKALVKQLKSQPWGSIVGRRKYRRASGYNLRWENDILMSRTPRREVVANTANKRTAIRFSPDGQPPYKQTGNLANGVVKEIVKRESDGQVTGSVFTTVPYAKEVEFGGTKQVDQSVKIHTRWRLTNPFLRAVRIAARPVWGPVFDQVRSEMIRAFEPMRVGPLKGKRIFKS